MVDNAIKIAGAKAHEYRILGYEQNLFNHMVAETRDEAATLSSLRDLFQKKHYVVGYNGDKVLVDTFDAVNLPLRGNVSKNIRD